MSVLKKFGNWLGDTAQKGLSWFGNAIGSFTDAINAGNRAYMKSENELAYQRELEMMKYQNEYNSPQAQMNRLAAAGLNPNMIYGTGSSSAVGNTATSTPQYQATTSELQPLALAMDTLSKFQDVMFKRVQTKIADFNLIKMLPQKLQQLILGNRYQNLKNEEKNNYVQIQPDILGTQLDLAKEQHRAKVIENIINEATKGQQIKKINAETLATVFGMRTKQFEAYLNKFGLTAHDSAWVRVIPVIAKLISEHKGNPSSSTWFEDSTIYKWIQKFNGVLNKFSTSEFETEDDRKAAQMDQEAYEDELWMQNHPDPRDWGTDF